MAVATATFTLQQAPTLLATANGAAAQFEFQAMGATMVITGRRFDDRRWLC